MIDLKNFKEMLGKKQFTILLILIGTKKLEGEDGIRNEKESRDFLQCVC